MRDRRSAAAPRAKSPALLGRDDVWVVRGGDASEPLFPPQRAFVVQFSKEADAAHEHYVGRIEHVVSGHAARFADSKELLKILAAELRKLGGAEAAASGESQGDQDGEGDERK